MISFLVRIATMKRYYTILLLLFCQGLWAGEISNIRTAKDGQKERVVIDIDGQKEPAFYVKKAKDQIHITIEATINEQRKQEFTKVLEKTRYINSSEFIDLNKENEVIITLYTKPGMKIYDEIFALPNPSRVVVDLEKAQYQ